VAIYDLVYGLFVLGSMAGINRNLNNDFSGMSLSGDFPRMGM
jgi:hypothetical protein